MQKERRMGQCLRRRFQRMLTFYCSHTYWFENKFWHRHNLPNNESYLVSASTYKTCVTLMWKKGRKQYCFSALLFASHTCHPPTQKIVPRTMCNIFRFIMTGKSRIICNCISIKIFESIHRWEMAYILIQNVQWPTSVHLWCKCHVGADIQWVPGSNCLPPRRLLQKTIILLLSR